MLSYAYFYKHEIKVFMYIVHKSIYIIMNFCPKIQIFYLKKD